MTFAARIKRTSSFTLIEILVVITIISILMSLLLPSLQDSKARSQAIACTSNHSQLFKANMTSAADADTDIVRYYQGGQRWPTLLWNYYQNLDILVCPDDNTSQGFGMLPIRELLANRPIDLTPGEQQRDFIYAGDVADAFWAAYTHGRRPEKGFRQYGVGTGRAVSLRTLVETLHELSGSSSELNFGALPYRPEEIMHSAAANQSLIDDFHWQPATTLRQGLHQTLAYFREQP